MMNDMNVEFEYQIRRNLKAWLTTSTAPAAPVEQAPLDGSGAPTAPTPLDGSGAPAAPTPLDGSGAPAAPAPLDGSGAPAVPAPPDNSGPPAAPVPSYTPAYPPTYLQPPPQPDRAGVTSRSTASAGPAQRAAASFALRRGLTRSGSC